MVKKTKPYEDYFKNVVKPKVLKGEEDTLDNKWKRLVLTAYREIIKEQQQEIERLNNIIDKLEIWLRESRDGERKEKSRLIQFDKSIEPIIDNDIYLYDKILGIIKELKEGKANLK